MSPTLDDPWSDRSVVPAALTVAREFRCLTQTELARLSGVARQHIVSIENGDVHRPTPITVNALAAALGLHPEFLAILPDPAPGQEVLHFRGKARVTGRVSAKLLALASIWTGLTRTLAAQCARLPSDSLSTIDPSGDVEQIAARTRAQWGLRDDTPIHHAIRLAERAGAFVGTFEGGEKSLDAFSWQAQRPYVLSNVERAAPTRARFNLLHEVGHLVMHRGVVTGDEATEQQANRFASALLLPRRAFWQEFPRSGSRLNWDGMFRMKSRWGASVQAIVSRAHDLGIIDAAEYKRAFVYISTKGWRLREPGEPAETERPELVPNIVASLARAQKLTPGRLRSELGLPVALINELTGSDVGRLLEDRHTVIRLGVKRS